MENAKNYNVLLIDDHDLSRRLLSRQLNAMGFETIDECANGQEGLDQIQQKDYHIVVFDWSMPIMDGLEFFKRTRNIELKQKTAFIMLSAESEPDRILEAMQAGVSYYLVKPVNQEKIEKTIESVIQWLHAE